ncbi:MAG: succinylglutamate desuccinylase/aspartoacylase family protein [Bryobacterales bacterium]|nr:succinylglutamate desuccinylase/aspartoacylase family protein [Bryobacterales bacterium]
MNAFSWNNAPPGQTTAMSLAVRGTDIHLPVIAVRGAHPGKTLLVSAGVHGDEYEGVQAIFDVIAALNPATMHGSLLAVPVANPPAFWNISRTSPLDDGNLARVFPGDPNGSPTQAIAYAFDQHLLGLADFYIDLHSAGVKWLMPTLIGYHEADQQAAPAAEAFGAPVIWKHPHIAPGRTVSAANDRRIPSLYAEARGSGRIHPDDLHVYRRGLHRLLTHLGITPGDLPRLPNPIRLTGDGNIDKGAAATQRGFLTPRVELLQSVNTGDLLGTLHDLWGREIERFLAPCPGVVVLIHACPLVHPGEPLFLLTERIA